MACLANYCGWSEASERIPDDQNPQTFLDILQTHGSMTSRCIFLLTACEASPVREEPPKTLG